MAPLELRLDQLQRLLELAHSHRSLEGPDPPPRAYVGSLANNIHTLSRRFQGTIDDDDGDDGDGRLSHLKLYMYATDIMQQFEFPILPASLNNIYTNVPVRRFIGE